MSKVQFVWKRKTLAYQTGEALYLNRICVAGFCWNISRSQGDNEAPIWVGDISLPSLKSKKVYGHSEAEIRAKIEKVVTFWFKEATKVIHIAEVEGGTK